jgi:hypothetical protein
LFVLMGNVMGFKRVRLHEVVSRINSSFLLALSRKGQHI